MLGVKETSRNVGFEKNISCKMGKCDKILFWWNKWYGM